jgi:hypothetical protein
VCSSQRVKLDGFYAEVRACDACASALAENTHAALARVSSAAIRGGGGGGGGGDPNESVLDKASRWLSRTPRRVPSGSKQPAALAGAPDRLREDDDADADADTDRALGEGVGWGGEHTIDARPEAYVPLHYCDLCMNYWENLRPYEYDLIGIGSDAGVRCKWCALTMHVDCMSMANAVCRCAKDRAAQDKRTIDDRWKDIHIVLGTVTVVVEEAAALTSPNQGRGRGRVQDVYVKAALLLRGEDDGDGGGGGFTSSSSSSSSFPSSSKATTTTTTTSPAPHATPPPPARGIGLGHHFCRTGVCIGGHTNPVWDAALCNELKFGLPLQTSAKSGTMVLRVEVWNQNLLADALIGGVGNVCYFSLLFYMILKKCII